jgi:dihydrofolate reductase
MQKVLFDRKTKADAEVIDEVHATTGAIVMGKRMFDGGVEPWGDPPPFRKPVFVVTHEPREPLPKQGGTTYIFASNGIEAALEHARPPPATRTSGFGRRQRLPAVPEGGAAGRAANSPRGSHLAS